MSDYEDADLFIEAQDTVWSDVLAELKNGRKQSHWMWFVFPQLAELGQSDMSMLYGIEDLEEAEAYLGDPELRRRLVEVSELMLKHPGKDAKDILGDVDAAKLKSSMTLFAAVPGAPDTFAQVLDTFYDGERCERTLVAIA
ncbi:MAG: DUF1810 domain-containing protein [Pseudomonadota bacterium]|nr:DUF1810 domain-containing protein [Pseudomonadota bacterium]